MVLVALAFAGLVVAVTMLLLTRGVLSSGSRWLPGVCRMDADSCARVVNHPHARILGVPNALVGVVFYAAVIVAAFSGGEGLLTVVRVLSLFAVAASVFLTWSLIAVVRRPCPLCITAHAVNIVLALLLNV
jgi:uncharacterized membrane protein